MNWPTAKELAGLPGMPSTERGVQLLAKRENWAGRKRSGSKALEYNPASLPAATRTALLDAAILALPETLCSLPEIKKTTALALADSLPAPASLAKWQRDTMDARLQILAVVEQLAGKSTLNKAIDRVIAQAKNELLPPHIQALIPVANARFGCDNGQRTLSRRTLFRWRELRAIGTTALAPVEKQKAEIPAWAPFFLGCYQKPQKPSVPMALEELALLLPEQIAMPSAAQARRLLGKMSKVDRERGRRSDKELRAILPCRRRDTSDLVPLEVTLCDGHSFKAQIAHPVHGRPFHPEVCAVIDAATRCVIGWSAGLAESAQTVADALRHAIQISPGNERGGIPAIFYTDPGSGNKAKVNADPAFGRYARLGITFKTGIVGNSQARGLVERMQSTLWVRAAKRLQTYTGTGMDSSVQHKTSRLLLSDIRKTGKSKLLPSWPQFLDLCQQAVDHYNDTPHSSLPKITDQSGKRRHLTPNEMYDSFLARGWCPDTCTPGELDDLFRPRVQVATRRGEVRLFGNTYFNSNLKHHAGEQVFVEYEPQNGQFVYVRELNEKLICKAEFDGNRSRMFAVSATEVAIEKRAEGRRKRLENQLEEVEAERRGLVEIAPSPQQIEAARALAVTSMAEPVASFDPGDNPVKRHRVWVALCEKRDTGHPLSADESAFISRYTGSEECKIMMDFHADFDQADQAI